MADWFLSASEGFETVQWRIQDLVEGRGGGALIVMHKGEALVRGTKCRAGRGSGKGGGVSGVSPSPTGKKIEIRKCLDDF